MKDRRLAGRLAGRLRNEWIESDVVPLRGAQSDARLLRIYDAIVIEGSCSEGCAAVNALRAMDVTIPALMLCEENSWEAHVQCLDCGFDYWLAETAAPEELRACLQALVRRCGQTRIVCFQLGNVQLSEGMILNVEKHLRAPLSLKESLLADLLMRNAGQVLTKDMLDERVWGFESRAEYNHLEVYVSFLRKKLAQIEASVQIRTVRGIGYVLMEKE